MALQSTSAWQTTPKSFPQLSETGLTQKQLDMQGSMYPGAFEPSQPKPKGEVSSQQLSQERAKQYQQQPEKLQKKKEELDRSGIDEEIARVSSKIGNFSHSLKGYINEFLTAAPADVGLQTYFDPLTNEIKTKSADEALDPAIKERQAQQAKILATLQPYLDKTTAGYEAKSFRDIAGQLMGQETGDTARVLSLIEALDMLERSGYAESNQAKRLRAQLDELDQFGLATQLKDAKKNYERLMGLAGEGNIEWYGETGKKGSTALDLATLTADEIKDELQKAMTAASGLFSGEVESSLRREFDTQSAGAKIAEEQSKAMNQGLKDALNAALGDVSLKLGENKSAIDTALSGMKDDIAAVLKNSPEAALWGDLLADNDTFLGVIQKAISDPSMGLAAKERALLQKYLGDISGENGQLYLWLNEVANTGAITVNTGTEDNPNMQTVKFSGPAKNEIIKIMQHPTLSAEDKNKKVKDLVLEQHITGEKSLRDFFGDILTATAKGESFDTVKNNFLSSLKQSLGTFVKSKTEDIFGKAMKQDPEILKLIPNAPNMSTAELVSAYNQLLPSQRESIQDTIKQNLEFEMQGVAAKYSENMTTAAKDAFKTVDKKMSDITNEMTKIQEYQEKVKNYPSYVWNKVHQGFMKSYNEMMSGLTEEIDAIKSNPGFRLYVEQGLAKPSDALYIARLIKYVQLENAYQKINPQYTPHLADKLKAAITIPSGNIFTPHLDMDMIKKESAEAFKDFYEIKNNPQKARESFMTNFMNSEAGIQMKSKMDELSKGLTNSFNELRSTYTSLESSKSQLEAISKDLKKATPLITSPEEFVNQLLHPQEKLAPELQGMRVIKGSDGVDYLQFGDGKYTPVTPELIQQLTALTTKVTTPPQIMSESDLVSGIEVPGLAGKMAFSPVSAVQLPYKVPQSSGQSSILPSKELGTEKDFGSSYGKYGGVPQKNPFAPEPAPLITTPLTLDMTLSDILGKIGSPSF